MFYKFLSKRTRPQQAIFCRSLYVDDIKISESWGESIKSIEQNSSEIVIKIVNENWMKIYKFDEEDEIDFLILGINSHVRPYKLCWEINKELNTNFVKTQNHRLKTKAAKFRKIQV